ncbi:MAG: hypothetical protein IKR34_01395 [Candidatus Gastranaerophilales bacterium]|nr:hypothetical protein [Candidatus Gastranaerophilales bacterium]
MIKEISDKNIIYARIVRSSYEPVGNEFFSRTEDELQIGILNYEENHKVGTHYHNRPQGFLNETDEILIVQEGSARIDFYDIKGVYLKSTEIHKGDLIILYLGAHNITYYEKSRIMIIKKGPYNQELDKTRIVGANNFEIEIDN